MPDSNIEIIDKFVANEKKARMWTLISVGLFCITALLIVYFKSQLTTLNGELKTANALMSRQQDSLRIMTIMLADSNSTLQSDNTTLTLSNKQAGNYDSLKGHFDTLAILLNNSLLQIPNANQQSAESMIQVLTQQTFNKQNIAVSKQLKDAILQSKAQIYTFTPDLQIYLHYMPEYNEQRIEGVKIIGELNYKIQNSDVISGYSFNPVVKYFNDADAEAANKIANALNKSGGFFANNPVTVKKLSLNNADHHIEVWIGRAKPIDPKQIFNNPRIIQQLQTVVRVEEVVPNNKIVTEQVKPGNTPEHIKQTPVPVPNPVRGSWQMKKVIH